ncbi:MAG: polysaccharide deacetylase, partial [Erysipelotrichaceae bacterium]|nr:polysaccharide deacetylase [Erysipelotrichaceae bacterium]
AEKGDVYFDWNVESGDAGRTTDPEKVVSNLISGTSNRAQTVALCHDSKSYTVEGIEKFLQWALQNGYSFAILDRSSPKAHHGIAN